MKKHHEVSRVTAGQGRLALTVDGRELAFALRNVSSRLAKAKEQELALFEISPSGYGIHWPLLDEDISIDGLLGIAHAPKAGKVLAKAIA